MQSGACSHFLDDGLPLASVVISWMMAYLWPVWFGLSNVASRVTLLDTISLLSSGWCILATQHSPHRLSAMLNPFISLFYLYFRVALFVIAILKVNLFCGYNWK